MGRRILFLLGCTVVLAAIWFLWTNHVATVRRAEKETGYQAVVSSLQQIIRSGTPRSKAEAFLNQGQLKSHDRSYAGIIEDAVPLGRKNSRHWYCSWEQVQVLIDYTPAVPLDRAELGAPALYKTYPDDKVKTVNLDYGLQDCL